MITTDMSGRSVMLPPKSLVIIMKSLIITVINMCRSSIRQRQRSVLPTQQASGRGVDSTACHAPEATGAVEGRFEAKPP